MKPIQNLQLIRTLTVVASLAGAIATHAQVVFTSFNTQTIDFDSTLSGVSNGAFTGAGFQASPADGQLDSDAWAITGFSDGALAVSGTQLSADYTRGVSTGPAGLTTAGVYSFTVSSGNAAMGVQPTAAEWTPGTITLRLQNQTGAPIGSLDISYTVWVRNDEDRSNSLNFSHSSNNSTYTPVASLDFTSEAAKTASAPWVSTSKTTTLTGLNVAADSYYFLRWTGDDVGGTGSRDLFAIDDIAITAIGAPVPEPSTYAGFAGALLLGFGVWRRSRRS
jgi:hypothetical protein